MPQSKGKIWIETKDPNGAPKIDLNLLNTEDDVKRLLEITKLARVIGATAPFSDFVHSELVPGSAVITDEQLEQSMKTNVVTYAHPTSSAPMGLENSPEAVVNLKGKVHGVASLRVVDASIFPDTISVATNVTTIAVAERIAQMMSKD